MSALTTGCLFAAVLLSTSGAARAVSPWEGQTDAQQTISPIEASVWSLLSPPAKAAKPDADQIAQQIARLGRDAIAPAVGILLGTLVEPESEVAVHPEVVEKREQILLAALRRLPSGAVIDELRKHAGGESSVDQRIAAVHVLGEIGGGAALDAILAIAASLEPIQWMRTYVQEPIENAIAQIARTDASHVKKVGRALVGGDARFAPILVRALGKAGSPDALPALVRVLGRDVEVDLAVAQELVHIVSDSYSALTEDDLRRLRMLLDSSDPRLVRGGAAALASLGDEESCAKLVALLGDDDPLTVSTAHWGLKRYSGLELSADQDAWERWHDRERVWFDTTYSAIVDAVTAEDADRLVSALTDALTHPLFKHKIAAAIEPGLNSENATLGRLCCSVLGQLGSRHSVPALVESLSSPDDALRTLACNALRALTGVDLPPDAARWKAVVGP